MPEENQPDRRLRYVAAIQDYQEITTITPVPPSTAPRIYLAGPMTGLPAMNYPAFFAEATRLRDLGYHVENPAETGAPAGTSWAGYMRLALAKLVTCDTIALLPGWLASRGANIERALAVDLGMKIVMAADITENARSAA